MEHFSVQSMLVLGILRGTFDYSVKVFLLRCGCLEPRLASIPRHFDLRGRFSTHHVDTGGEAPLYLVDFLAAYNFRSDFPRLRRHTLRVALLTDRLRVLALVVQAL